MITSKKIVSNITLMLGIIFICYVSRYFVQRSHEQNRMNCYMLGELLYVGEYVDCVMSWISVFRIFEIETRTRPV